MKIINDQGICRTAPVHWCLMSLKSGFARAKVPCLPVNYIILLLEDTASYEGQFLTPQERDF